VDPFIEHQEVLDLDSVLDLGFPLKITDREKKLSMFFLSVENTNRVRTLIYRI